MSCLTHNKRFRALFHNVINELRSENQTPISILHGMPRLCCTCNDEVHETVTLNEYNAFTKLEKLIEKVIREKDPNARLILSLNRLGNLIQEHRMPPSTASEEKQNTGSVSSSSDHVATRQVVDDLPSSSDSSSSSEAEDFIPMDTSKSNGSHIRPPVQKSVQKEGKRGELRAPKPVKSGTFVFLPYTVDGKKAKKQTDAFLEVAKELQRRRFISAGGHIPQLENQYHIRINMITSKTSPHIAAALEDAKKALGNLKIHDKNETLKVAAKEDGEWVLVRSKNTLNKAKAEDIDEAIGQLTSRWSSALTIDKRASNPGSHASGSKRPRK